MPYYGFSNVQIAPEAASIGLTQVNPPVSTTVAQVKVLSGGWKLVKLQVYATSTVTLYFEHRDSTFLINLEQTPFICNTGKDTFEFLVNLMDSEGINIETQSNMPHGNLNVRMVVEALHL